MVVAHDATQAFILVFVQLGAGKVSLETALGPVIWVLGLIARCALQVVEVGAVVIGQGHRR